uniref:CSON012972 protein n=1 Tax=Culicoides sonorensis TaxID=179676 RepID=A0A336KNC8_CULSO
MYTFTCRIYQRYETICKYLEYLCQKYPRHIKMEAIGQSYENRDIKMVRISENFKGSRPCVFIEAGCHAREWISVATALNIIHQLVEKFQDNQRCLKKLDFYIVPLLNPDGYEYSHEKNKNWRKTRRPNEGTQQKGTDINRNFDIGWKFASKRPSLSNYRGPHPFSEQETCALRDILQLLKSSCKFYIAIHSFAKALLYPWACKRKLCDSWKKLHSLAKVGHDAIIKATGKRYVYGSASTICRRTVGGSSPDYAFSLNIPFVITIEMSGKGFHPPKDKIKEIVHEGWVAVKEMVLFVAKTL